jgi:hypothetical protein
VQPEPRVLGWWPPCARRGTAAAAAAAAAVVMQRRPASRGRAVVLQRVPASCSELQRGRIPHARLHLPYQPRQEHRRRSAPTQTLHRDEQHV